MNEFVQYVHHGRFVWVKDVLKGKHSEHSLCYSCTNFKPKQKDNCPLAQDNFEYCIKNSLVLPVWECPEFKEKVDNNLK